MSLALRSAREDAPVTELVIEQRDGLAAVRPKSAGVAWHETRLKKDETFDLLVIRYICEDATRRGEMDETGRVETNTDEIYDAYKTLAGSEPPPEARMKDILWICKQRGLVRPGDPDKGERVTPVTVLPGIRVVITDTFVEAVIDWVEKGAVDAEETFFDRLHAHLDGDGDGNGRPATDGDQGDATTAEGADTARDGADGDLLSPDTEAAGAASPADGAAEDRTG